MRQHSRQQNQQPEILRPDRGDEISVSAELVLLNESQQMIFRNLIFQAEVVKQRFGTGVLPALLRQLLPMHIGLPADVVFEQVLRQATK